MNNMLNINNLEMLAFSIPGPIYWKDKNGIYLGMNEFALEASALRTFSNFIGKTDRDLWPEFSDLITRNDQKVIQTGQSLQEKGAITLPNGEMRYYKAIKVPLWDNNDNIIGVVGNYTDITDLIISIIDAPTESAQNGSNDMKLPNRVLECVKLLKEGLSSKQIACLLNISNRTVEQYIDTAKNRLGCKNSVELIYKCFKNGILS